jgi:acyl carrier protein phosphodiesterase
MNYLAHFYLSFGNDELILGNLIADTVKGKLNSERFSIFDKGIIKGVQLHREIDRFTDSHPIVKQSIHRIKPKYGRYASVLVDMYYDHLLARNWHSFSNEPLEIFAQRMYSLFAEKQTIIPPEMDRLVQSMTQRDWLCNYRQEETLSWAFAGLARRAKFNSKMELGMDDLLEHYLDFLNDFLEFFPIIISHCQLFINTNAVIKHPK